MTARSSSNGPVLQHQQSSASSSSTLAAGSTSASASTSSFRVPRTKGLNRPGTWFSGSSFGKSSTSSTSSSSSSSSGGGGGVSSTSSGSGSNAATSSANVTAKLSGGLSPTPNPFNVGSFKSPFPSSKGKHKLSPSPSPSSRQQQDEDFVMISPVRPAFGLGVNLNQPHHHTSGLTPSASPSRLAYLQSNSMMREDSSSSSPLEESPTPACGMATATARLKLVDDDSPIRRIPGQSRSLRASKGGEDPRSIFLSTERERREAAGRDQSSPLKFTSSRLMAGDEDDDSPQLPPTPLMSNGLPVPPPQPLFPPIRASQSQDGTSSGTLFSSTSKTDSSRIPRLSTSHPLRARAGTDAERPTLGLSTKKAISLDQIPTTGGGKDELFGSNSHIHVKKTRPASTFGPSGISGLPSSSSQGRAHKRINSGEYHGLHSGNSGSISRSFGAKSLALSLTPNLGPLPDFSYSNSSLSSLSTANLTPPASAFSPAEPPIFEDVKPLQEAFEQPNGTVSRKFKPRDSGVSMGDADEERPKPKLLIPPPSVMKPLASSCRPRRPAMLKRTSSMGDERQADMDVETPGVGPMMASGWPMKGPAFDFLGEGGMGMSLSQTQTGAEAKPSMPGTPVKKNAFAHSGSQQRQGIGHSSSQPTLGSTFFDSETGPLEETSRSNMPPPTRSTFVPPPSTKKPPPSVMKKRTSGGIPALTLTTTSSPEWAGSGADTDDAASSPTVRLGGSAAQSQAAQGLKPLTLGCGAGPGKGKNVGSGRIGLLRRLSNGPSESEDEGTPTKALGDRTALAAIRSDMVTPTPSPKASSTTTTTLPPVSHVRPPPGTTISAAASGSGILPRLSLPAFPPPKPHHHRTLHHRQSHPATSTIQAEEEDVFEKRFITLEVLGKGAFSTVVKVQDRHGEGLWAVKKARGVFDGVKDRLRHLEEVDILRHLSRTPNPHVVKFEDAWEQNRQLFIQTELCLGSLSFFLEEYGRVVERLDEGRVWKIIRELSDGLKHIHSNGVIHFDIKPANILISAAGSLKIGDFGLATRWPRIEPAKILEGSGLGAGNTGSTIRHGKGEKLEREGDRVYMPPEMLRGVFVMAADVFSFGLVILEVSTNICVPDGGPPWHALRSNDFSVVDLSPLSPALCDLITQCMAAEPDLRPTIQHIVSHPVVQRAKSGKAALAPEDKGWLVDVLAGGFMPPTPGQQGEDVEMGEA
ncbi:WEE protein kinase [Kwoniella heveanensis CBS 569]|nr:WEE protein kinase [Kwoniella heveanensis CBS 569]